MSLVSEGRLGRVVRRAKADLLGVRRRIAWSTDPGWAPPQLGTRPATLAWSRRIALALPGGDPVLEAGKRHNVRLAAIAFDGVELSCDRPLSFWRALGPPTEARGFRRGIEVRGGCVVPSVGGGLCAISNALFALAAELGWHVLERHGHSVALADPRALDATVAWPHVDLRIAPRRGRAVLSVRADDDALTIEAWTDAVDAPRAELAIEEARDVELDRADLDRSQARRRHLRIRRRVHDGARLIEDRLIVDDAKAILAPTATAALRTCLTCDETACPTGRHERARLARAEADRASVARPATDRTGGSTRIVRLAVLR